MRTPTGRFGGAVETGGSPFTLGLIAACVVVFVMQQMSPRLSWEIAFVPALGLSQPWRFLSSAFAHGGVTHILFNMMALWQVGTALERVLGRWRFLGLYLLSALAGSVGFLVLAFAPTLVDPLGSNWTTPTVGASGAVFGLFGAFLVLARRSGLDVRGMLVWLGLNVVIGFTVPSIAWQAHLGGFLCGAAIAYALSATAAPERRRYQWPLLGLVLLVVVGLAVAKYAASPSPLVYG